MRRTVSIFLAVLTIISFLPSSTVHAEQSTMIESNIILPDDEGYIEIVESQVAPIAFGTITKKGLIYVMMKTGILYGLLSWQRHLHIMERLLFALHPSCDVTILSSTWYVVSKSATKGGNTAKATVTMGRKLVGVTIDKETYNITLTCDKNGNVSWIH